MDHKFPVGARILGMKLEKLDAFVTLSCTCIRHLYLSPCNIDLYTADYQPIKPQVL